MLSTDREDFDVQLSLLCQGYGFWVGDRSNAYWKGLSKMQLSQFARCVEFALSEDGPEKIPNVHGIWKIYRSLRTPAPVAKREEKVEADHLLYYANRMFLAHLTSRGGLGSTGTFVPGHGLVDCKASNELIAARKAVTSLVDWFAGPIMEGDSDACPRQFITLLIRALNKVSPLSEQTQRRWEEMAARHQASIPFPKSMGRKLETKTTAAA